MSVMLHLTIALAYFMVTAAVAVGLPQTMLGIDQTTAVVIAILGVLGGGIVHLAVIQLLRGRRFASLIAEQNRLKTQLSDVCQALVEGDRAMLSATLAGTTEEVVAERKVIRFLRDQIAPQPGEPGDEDVLELGDELLEIRDEPPMSPPPDPDVEPEPEEERQEPKFNLGLDREEFLRNVGRADIPMGEMAPQPPESAADTNQSIDMMGDLRREFVEPSIEAQEMLKETREALREGRVSVFLQPVVSLPTRKVTFYESFSRIRAADGTHIGPGQYIPIAEQEGLVSAIDNNLLFRCIQLVRKTRQHNRNYSFFCNISPYTLRDRSFFPQFLEFINENEELAESLIFELGQEDLLEMDAEVELNLKALAAVGFQFSMDRITSLDLDYDDLARRHFGYVKIDAEILRSLIAQDKDGAELNLLQAELNRAGIELVVEKIETEQMLVEFLDFPITFAQGYLFGEPRLSKLAA